METQSTPSDIRSALSWAQGELVKTAVESTRLTAELLLAHVLGCDRVRIIAHDRDSLEEEEFVSFAALIKRRAAGEPLQYLTGKQEFFGLAFRVTPAVLIPRPETEILVERAVELARSASGRSLRFVDVGTGSGCIAVAFAHSTPEAVGWGVDVSPETLHVAQDNATMHGVSGRVHFACGDLLECMTPRPCFDLIMSNPPYVSRGNSGTLSATVREHEPHLALFAGNSGMEAYLRLIPAASRRLAAGGRLLLEVGMGMSAEVARLIEANGLLLEDMQKDLQGIPRCLIARRNNG